MSYFKQLRASLENEELLPEGELTPEAEAEADVAMAEAEVVRQEIENNIDSQERAEAVVEELEGTNEALTNIAANSPDGTIDETTAAMAEAQRRTAAVAVGLDPDEGAGAELVDQAGLESLVDGTYLSLEEATDKNRTMIQKIKDFIKRIGKAIVAGWEKFKNFIAKVFDVLPKQISELASWVKSSKDLPGLINKFSADDKEEFERLTKELPSAKGTSYMTKELKDFSEVVKAVVATKNMGELNTVVKSKLGEFTIHNGKYIMKVYGKEANVTFEESNTPVEGLSEGLVKAIFKTGVKDINFIRDNNTVIGSHILKNQANIKQIEAKEGEELTFEQKRQNCVNKLANINGKSVSAVITFYKNAVKLVKALQKIEAKANKE